MRNDIQDIIDRAVDIATGHAMHGNPVERVIYISAQTATGNDGFAVKFCESLSASETPPWER